MLEAQGPFFPKVVALEVLGELRAVHFIPEVMEYLSDENSYVYGAAERALARMGEAIVAPAVERIESGTLDPDAAHSVLVLLCDLGTPGLLRGRHAPLRLVHGLGGPGDHHRVGQPVRHGGADRAAAGLAGRGSGDGRPGLLLLGAIHNVQIPEEEEILQAIEDERARQGARWRRGAARPARTDGGDYVM